MVPRPLFVISPGATCGITPCMEWMKIAEGMWLTWFTLGSGVLGFGEEIQVTSGFSVHRHSCRFDSPICFG